MEKKNILFFTYWYPNKNNNSFGIFVKRHAHSAMLNNNVIILSFNIQKNESFYKKTIEIFNDEAGLETHQITIEIKFNKLFYVLLPLHYLIIKNYINSNLIKNNKFSIIHSNVIFPCGIVGFWLSKKFNLKHIITEHWTKIDKFFKISLYAFFAKKYLKLSHKITVVSIQLHDTLKKHIQNKQIIIVPNVVTTNEFSYNINIEKNSEVTFIAVANWSQFKNPFYFLNALQLISQKKIFQKFKVVLVGEGVQLEEVKRNSFNFEINYLGNLNPNQLCNEYNKSHFFLHGSDFETFSVVIAEALMCGLPSIVSPVGIAQEVINESNGFITNNTIEDWVTKIELCTKKVYDYKLISDQIKNKYSAKTVGDMFTEIYNSI